MPAPGPQDDPLDPEPLELGPRVTVELKDEVVVFLIGMKINRWWRVWSWLPVALAMGRMMRELGQQPERGLLATRQAGPGLMVQYWRSFEALTSYARDSQAQHAPAWADFWRRVARSGDVGIWHETYRVRPEQIECVYHHMPRQGLARLGKVVPATGRRASARGRMGSPQASG